MKVGTCLFWSLQYLHGLRQCQDTVELRKYLLNELTRDCCPGKYGEGVEVAPWLGRLETLLPADGRASVHVV